jgi:hypothetical protein
MSVAFMNPTATIMGAGTVAIAWDRLEVPRAADGGAALPGLGAERRPFPAELTAAEAIDS